MKPITHPFYKDYPEQPYISPERDIIAWENSPGLFPYSKVEKKQMQRLPEGLLPGDIIMLWRIHFGNFTNKSMIPQYFEYRYGVDSEESIQTLIKLGYVKISSATDSLLSLNMNVLKVLLEKNNLDTKGKKEVLLARIAENVPEKALSSQFTLRRYLITPSGEKILKKYNSIVQKHGPKM